MNEDDQPDVDGRWPRPARVFRLFGVLACAVTTLGLLLSVLEGADPRRAFSLRFSFAPWVWGDAVLTTGLWLLLALPLVRNTALLHSAAQRGDRGTFALAATVNVLVVGVLALAWWR